MYVEEWFDLEFWSQRNTSLQLRVRPMMQGLIPHDP